MIYKKLFKLDNKGKIRELSIDLDHTTGAYRSITGLVGGKLITHEWKYVKQMNVGRSNETSIHDQLIATVERIVKDSIEKDGYRETVDDAQTSIRFSPMLAQKFDESKFNWDQPVFISPKFDGIRCNISADSIKSRRGVDIVSVPHLEFLKDFAKEYNCILDGELYNHDIPDFEDLVGIIKKTKLKPDDVEKSVEFIKYYIYDVYFIDQPLLRFEERFNKLDEVFGEILDKKYLTDIYLLQKLKLVYYDYVKNIESVKNIFNEHIEQGYEGSMIRLDTPYEVDKRSKGLLKYKVMQDDEFTVVEIVEGIGSKTGTCASVKCRDKTGKEFSAGVDGTNEYRAGILSKAKELIGTLVTVQYFSLSKYGIPRFPVVKLFHESKEREY